MPASLISQTITAIPVPGHRGVDSQNTFVTKQEAFQDALQGTTVTELNTFRTQANALATQANADATTAFNSAGTATTKAAEALASANAASASAASAAALAGAFVGTSTTSLLIGTGSKSFTTQTSEQYTAGIFMVASSQANPSNYMFGQVTSYNALTGDLVLNVTIFSGGGTYADWNLSLTGVQGPAGPTFTGGSLTSALNVARATVVSHATTADIWGAAGNQIDFTGTATVTAFPNAPQAGAERVLICADACSFTASVNMKIDGVPSGTVTCAAGDTVTVRALSTTIFKLTRQKADGTPQVSATGGAKIWLGTVTSAGAATIDVEHAFDNTYDKYEIEAEGVALTSAITGTLFALLKIGGSYLVTNYSVSDLVVTSPQTYETLGPTYDKGIITKGMGNTSEHSCNFTMRISKPYSTTTRHNVSSYGSSSSSAAVQGSVISSAIANSTLGALTGIRFYNDASNISGTFRLYGIKTS